MKQRNVLLAIAHPDDECMFFGPTLEAFYQSNDKLHVICLSNGDADGLGKIREKELIESCKIYHINQENIIIVNDTNLRDGMNQVWSSNHIIPHLENALNKWNIDHILTFDDKGISGHPNHISVFNAVKEYLIDLQHNIKQQHHHHLVTGESLETVNLIRKYIGVADVLVSPIVNTFISTQPKKTSHISSILPFGNNFLAMKKHASQFVWFRYLFVFFSRYSYINTLVDINELQK